jgi:hypothetical protein
MEKYGNGNFIVTKVYYDSPREDCSGYYEDEFCFATLEEATKAFYDWRDNADACDPVGFYVNFDIPRMVRIQHGLDMTWECRSLNGKYRKRFNYLRDAISFRNQENALALKLYRIDNNPELRAQINGDFRYKIYAL